MKKFSVVLMVSLSLFLIGSGVVLFPRAKFVFAAYLENMAYAFGYTSSTKQLESLCSQAPSKIVVKNMGTDVFDFILPIGLYNTNNRVETVGWYSSSESLIRFIVNGTKAPFKPLTWQSVPTGSYMKYTKTNPGAEFVVMFVTGEQKTSSDMRGVPTISIGAPVWGCGYWKK